MSSEIDNILYKVNSSLIEKGIVTEPNYRISSARPSEMNHSQINSEGNKLKDSTIGYTYNGSNYYNNNELQKLRNEMNNNFEILRKELNEKTQCNNSFYYNDQLSKFRVESHEQDNNLMIQMREMWLKMKEMSNEINYLKGKTNEFNLVSSQLVSNHQELKLKEEANSSKINDIIKENTSNQKMEESLSTIINPKIGVLNHQMNNLLMKVGEIDKQQNELCLSVNKLNNNTVTIDNNVKKMFTKTKENSEEIKDLQEKMKKSDEDIIYLKTQAITLNDIDNIEGNKIKNFQANIDSQFKAMMDKYDKEINSLKIPNEKNYLLEQKLSGPSDTDLSEIRKKLEKIENNLKTMFENMKILNQNNENMKEDVKKTFDDLHKWQEDLVVNINKGLDELQTEYSNQHSQLCDEIQTLRKKNDNKNEVIKIEHPKNEEVEKQTEQEQQNKNGVVPNNREVNLLDDWTVN